jgi:hypothetical protein
MIERLLKAHGAIERVFLDSEYAGWIANQKGALKFKAGEAKETARDSNHPKNVRLTIAVLQPALAVATLRSADGKIGATIGELHGRILALNAVYNSPIEGLNERSIQLELEGWLTNKRRNRLGETVLDRLMRLHANLILLGSLEAVYFAAGELVVCPWELESEIPEADDNSAQLFRASEDNAA